MQTIIASEVLYSRERQRSRRSAMTGKVIAALFALVVASSCATGAPRSEIEDVITREQIADLPYGTGTALSIVQQLEPRWLRARNPGGRGRPEFAWIFVDNQSFGPLESLESISREVVIRIEYLDSRDATIQYGTGYPGGIIRVVTIEEGPY